MQDITGLPGTLDRYSSFTLVELERRVGTGIGTYTSTFYRYCNAPQNIPYNGAVGFDRPAVGAVFSRRNFPNPTVVADGNLGNVTQIVFDDFDDALKVIAVQYDMLDWRVRVWEAGVDASFTITWIKLKVSGRTEDKQWDVQESDTFSLDVGSTGAVVDTAGIREEYSRTCRFVRGFKRDPRCGASSAAALAASACDGQFSTCKGFANELRYGGFPDAFPAGTIIGVWGGTGSSYNSRMAFFPPNI